MIREPTGGPIQQKKSRSFTLLERPLSDLIFWQVIVELVQSHKAWSLAGFSWHQDKERRSRSHRTRRGQSFPAGIFHYTCNVFIYKELVSSGKSLKCT